MSKKTIKLSLMLIFLGVNCFFINNVKAVNYEGWYGSYADPSSGNGCTPETEYFTVGGSNSADIFYDTEDARSAEIERRQKDNCSPDNGSCMNEQENAVNTQFSNISNEAARRGYTKQTNGSFTKSGGYPDGCWQSTEDGVRVSIVNVDGTVRYGYKDFWEKDKLPLINGEGPYYSGKVRTEIVNGSNVSFSKKTFVNSGYGLNRTNVLETLREEVKIASDNQAIDPNGYLRILGVNDWSDLRADDYILMEPLYKVTIGNKVYIGTGTEMFKLVYVIEPRTTFLQGAGFGSNTILYQLYLGQEGIDNYELYSRDSSNIYEKVEYPGKDVQDTEAEKDHSLVLGNSPAKGYAMNIIWLGEYIKQKKPKCCIPCGDEPTLSENPTEEEIKKHDEWLACKEQNKNNGYKPNDLYCCEEIDKNDEIIDVIDDKEVCVPADEYWKDRQDYYDEVCGPKKCVPPFEGSTECCNDPGWCDLPENKVYCETYCPTSSESTCHYSLVDPKIELGVCDDQGNHISWFKDSLYTIEESSEIKFGEQLDENDIEAIVHVNGDPVSDKFISIPYIIKEGNHNASYSNNTDNNKSNQIPVDMYLESESDYCATYCQESVEIILPKNYPYTKAGRYFNWNNGEDDNAIVTVKGEKTCVHDIKLDKWLADYSEEARKCDAAGTYLATCISRKQGDELVKGINNCIDYWQDAYNSCEKNIPEKNKVEYNRALNNYNTAYERWYSETWPKVKGKYSAAQDPETIYKDSDEGGTLYNAIPELCVNERENLEMSRKSTTIYNTCISDDNNELANLGSKLESCFENIDEESYNSSLNIEYGYETLFSQYLYNTPDDIKKISNYSFDKVDSCYKVDSVDPCNPEKVFISDGDACANECNEQGCTLKGTDGAPPATPNFFQYVKCDKFGNVDTVDTGNGIVTIQGCTQSHDESIMQYGLNYVKKAECVRNDDGPYACTWQRGENNVVTIDPDHWKTIVVTKETITDNYYLDEKINACICKDGTIKDALDDGSCDCPKPETVYEIVSDISTENYCYYEWKSYTTLDKGNFSIEYMNPTGWYPLYLTYGNIGYESHSGRHFSTMLEYLNFEKCPGGTCKYSDEDQYCVFYIDNDILNDGGKKEDAICPDGECDYVCPDGECPYPSKPDDFDCPNGSCITGMELIYRVIDLDTPFPGSDATGENSSRVPGANWLGTTDEGNLVVNEYIGNNRGVEGSKLYNSDLDPLYEFTINPAIIKKIRALNAANRDYASLSTMVFDDATIVGGVSYVLRGDLKNIIETNGGYFSINLDDKRFDLINKNSAIDSSGNLATCRGGE